MNHYREKQSRAKNTYKKYGLHLSKTFSIHKLYSENPEMWVKVEVKIIR